MMFLILKGLLAMQWVLDYLIVRQCWERGEELRGLEEKGNLPLPSKRRKILCHLLLSTSCPFSFCGDDKINKFSMCLYQACVAIYFAQVKRRRGGGTVKKNN